MTNRRNRRLRQKRHKMRTRNARTSMFWYSVLAEFYAIEVAKGDLWSTIVGDVACAQADAKDPFAAEEIEA